MERKSPAFSIFIHACALLLAAARLIVVTRIVAAARVAN